MISLKSISRIEWIVLIFAVNAIILMAAPAPRWQTPTVELASLLNNPSPTKPLVYDELAKLFDLTRLPIAVIAAPIPQPIDPLTSIRQFSLVGITMTEDTSLALISTSDGVQTILVGDMLADFIVTTISARQITLQKDGFETVITLGN